MRNPIPYFIQQQYQKEKLKGQFKAASMFVDISGFTKLTETLMHYEKNGAEVLTQVIFNPLVKSIYDHGGLITAFAGGAFTALFPLKQLRDI
ncbi:MAG: hypothetical protein B6244_13505 [Candidatus Cloacimonetes bacterium 4572_55]|nr:MAG: hypothetical protein B6244_13505 [Candidatus Cloacimonetes bacterium 4572_55]